MNTSWRIQQLERARELREIISHVRVLHKKIVLLRAARDIETALVLDWIDKIEDQALEIDLSVAIDDYLNK